MIALIIGFLVSSVIALVLFIYNLVNTVAGLLGITSLLLLSEYSEKILKETNNLSLGSNFFIGDIQFALSILYFLFLAFIKYDIKGAGVAALISALIALLKFSISEKFFNIVFTLLLIYITIATLKKFIFATFLRMNDSDSAVKCILNATCIYIIIGPTLAYLFGGINNFLFHQPNIGSHPFLFSPYLHLPIYSILIYSELNRNEAL